MNGANNHLKGIIAENHGRKHETIL